MVIKASDSNLNLDERFRLTKRDKVRMKGGERKKKRSRQTEDSANRVCCLTLSADVVVQVKKKKKRRLFRPKTGSNNLLWSPVTP